MAFSEFELRNIDTLVGGLCRAKTSPKHRDQLNYTYEIDRHAVTIWENRPGWKNPNEWTKMGVARFRYLRTKKIWKLYWMRRDLKWHAYDPEVSTSKSLDKLVKVVPEDEWHAFFG